MNNYLEGFLPEWEKREVTSHLRQCSDCAATIEQTARLRSTLRTLPKRNPPEKLTASLRVLASRELARRREHTGLWSSLAFQTAYIRLWARNLMRPLAIPFAGGLVSAVVLFSMLMPSMPVRQSAYVDDFDVPTALYTEASLKSAMPFSIEHHGFVVDFYVDEKGRLLDYSIPYGNVGPAVNAELRRNIEKNILVTQFTPATAFGQPMSGKVRVYFRRSYIDVIG